VNTLSSTTPERKSNRKKNQNTFKNGRSGRINFSKAFLRGMGPPGTNFRAFMKQHLEEEPIMAA